jgi:hypothetical protein
LIRYSLNGLYYFIEHFDTGVEAPSFWLAVDPFCLHCLEKGEVLTFEKWKLVPDSSLIVLASDNPELLERYALMAKWMHVPKVFGSIETLEGTHRVTPGDWIITGVKGEHYPCKPDIFAATYEEVV